MLIDFRVERKKNDAKQIGISTTFNNWPYYLDYEKALFVRKEGWEKIVILCAILGNTSEHTSYSEFFVSLGNRINKIKDSKNG